MLNKGEVTSFYRKRETQGGFINTEDQAQLSLNDLEQNMGDN